MSWPSVYSLASWMLFAFAFSTTVPTARGAEANLVERAQAAIDHASRQYTRGDYAGALESLRTAERLAEKAEDPSLPSIRFNIARCLEKLERWEEALEAYRRYNDLPDASHRKERAFRAVEKLEGRVFATLSVACDPVGATVEARGLEDGTASCPYKSTRVPPGSYAIKVSHPGYLPTTELIDLEAGQPFALEVALVRDPDAVLNAATAPPRRRFRPWPWAAVAASAASIGIGAGFTVGAINERDAAEQLPEPEAQSQVDAFETKRNLSYVFYGLGGAFAATSAALFLFTGNDDDTDPQKTRLEVSSNGLRLRFR